MEGRALDADAGRVDIGGGKSDLDGNPVLVSSSSLNICGDDTDGLELGGGKLDFEGSPALVSSSSLNIDGEDMGSGLVDFVGGPICVSSSSLNIGGDDAGVFGRLVMGHLSAKIWQNSHREYPPVP